MGILQDTENVVREYLSEGYDIQPFQGIPSIDHVGLGRSAKKLKMTALAVDLRNSSVLPQTHGAETAARIHKAFLYCATQAVLQKGGEGP